MLRPEAEAASFISHRSDAAVPLVEVEEGPDVLRLLRHDAQAPAFGLVSQRNVAAHPQPLALRRGNLVPDALGGDLALELREGQEHVERQPPHAGAGIERLRDRDERCPGSIQPLDQPGEVRKRPRQPVDLVDDDLIDAAGVDLRHQALQRRALQVPSRDAAVVVTVGEQDPALVPLAPDEGLAGLALRIERVEVLLETLLRGLPRVDRAAEPGHAERLPVKPKNRGPDQAVPVIRFATADSDRYVVPLRT